MRWSNRPNYVERTVDRVLEESQLSIEDQRWVRQAIYGIVDYRHTLETLARFCLNRPLPDYEPTILEAIYLGLYQLIYMRVPDHAAVHETIEAFKQRLESGSTIVNGVLRRITRELVPIENPPPPAQDYEVFRTADGFARLPGIRKVVRNEVESIAFRYAHPVEMIRIWRARYNDSELFQILDWNNGVSPVYAVLKREVSPGLWSRKAKLAGYDVQATELEQVFELPRSAPIERLPGYDEGQFWIQDKTAYQACELLPAAPSATLLDLCAAPGGKLCALLDRGDYRRAIACDVSDSKIERLRANLTRLGATGRPGSELSWGATKVELEKLPAQPDQIRFREKFDEILIDVPCSNTGVFAKRHEARLRFLPEILQGLHRLQRKLLKAGLEYLGAGGHLLYSTCSIEPSENEEMVQHFLHQNPGVRLLDQRLSLPGEERSDGGYAALLKRIH